MTPLLQQRQALLTSFQQRGITNPLVLDAIQRVPREEFVSQAMRQRAYEDSALPIDAHQTISQPFTVAFMTQALQVGKGSKVLEIGTGSGYQAAVLAAMGCDVYSIERHDVLSRKARIVLERLGLAVHLRVGDGTIGWNEHAPYDGIIVTAGAPDVPEALAKQLSIGGRLVVPVGPRDEQTLYRVTRTATDDWSAEDLGPFRFVPLIGRQGWQGE
jgi:protein-L-isoaspartate(D-aspartate) O-methyltransferase